MSYLALLKNIWDAVYDPQMDVIETIEKYFHPDYKQCINGIEMKRAEYIQHVITQKQNMIIKTIDYKYALEKNNELFAIYCPKGKNLNHLPVEAEVIAYFLFKDQQLLNIHGQVRLTRGNLDDVDMK